MKKSVAAASPDHYVAALRGWRKTLVEKLRKAVRAAAPLEEVIKWRHLVYFSTGPALFIRAAADEDQVLFGFWRGQRLTEIDDRLQPGGKYEMATIGLGEGDDIPAARVKKLVQAAVALNKKLGDPQKDAKR